MLSPQAENIQRRFLPIVDQGIAELKAQAVNHDEVLADFVNDAEVIVLVYAAFSFVIGADRRLAPLVGELNGALAGELTRTINHYADRARIGSRPFHEDERADFARTIYERVYRGAAGYATTMRRDADEAEHRQTMVFADTSHHFLDRYIVEPPMRARVVKSRLAYGQMLDHMLDEVLRCMRVA